MLVTRAPPRPRFAAENFLARSLLLGVSMHNLLLSICIMRRTCAAAYFVHLRCNHCAPVLAHIASICAPIVVARTVTVRKYVPKSMEELAYRAGRRGEQAHKNPLQQFLRGQGADVRLGEVFARSATRRSHARPAAKEF